MNSLAKKRTKAILIDTAVSTAVSLAAEALLRKKVKSEMFFSLVVPTLTFWGLEYAQLHLNGQTLGQKAMGIRVKSETGGKLTNAQILKRAIHRDSVSSIVYLKERRKYDAYEGAKFPHDVYTHTVVTDQ